MSAPGPDERAGDAAGAAGDDGAPSASPAQRRVERLLTSLLERTRSESIAWGVDDARPDSYCLVGDGWMLATRSTDGDGVAPFSILITDGEGAEVVEIRSTSPFGRPLSQLFAELHAVAAASARLAESGPVLDQIIDEIGAPSRAVGSAD